tara:strand:+ start:230 stop:895 length:666 start_codon:yes stop_codon:yes gene_type:complete
MASRKEYAYYLRGSQIAIIQKDHITGSGQTLTAPGLNDVGRHGDLLWKSPIATVADGLEIEYAYSPNYRINDIEDKSTALTGYDESSGLLKFTGSGLSTDAAITHIVIKGSERWNGLHKINTLNANYWIVETKYNGVAVTESGITAYTDINVLDDEGDTIDVASYLTKALVYYVKARIAEDTGQIDGKEYFMREFRRILEKHESARISGPRMIAAGPFAIR